MLHYCIAFGIMLILYPFGISALFSLFGYLLFLVPFYWIIPRFHRKGISLLYQGNYSESIIYFEKSIEYFERKKWLDTYRHLFLLVYSDYSFREAALMNIAFCKLKLKRNEEAVEDLMKILAENPKNILAKNYLNKIILSP